MIVIAVDPGSEQSGLVVWDGECILSKGIASNLQVVAYIANLGKWSVQCNADAVLVIEYTKPYALRGQKSPQEPNGRPYVPEQLYDTAFFAGQIAREWEAQTCLEAIRLNRSDVIKHFAVASRGATSTKDSQILNKLTKRFGPKGTKAAPGVTYGLSSHMWQALAVAVTYLDQQILADF